MRLLPVLASLASMACLTTAASITNTVEFDLVYPRDNQSYHPTPHMPVVFAIQNPKLAQNLHPYITFRVQSTTDASAGKGTTYNLTKELTWATADTAKNTPYFVYTFVDAFAKEGGWTIWWNVYWTSCKTDRAGEFHGETTTNKTATTSILLKTSIKNGQAVDLLATNDLPCGALPAFVLDDVDDELLEVTGAKSGFKSCVKVSPAADSWTPATLCDVKFDDEIAGNVTDALADLCASEEGCPGKTVTDGEKENSAGRVAGGMALAGVFGVLVLLLA